MFCRDLETEIPGYKRSTLNSLINEKNFPFNYSADQIMNLMKIVQDYINSQKDDYIDRNEIILFTQARMSDENRNDFDLYVQKQIDEIENLKENLLTQVKNKNIVLRDLKTHSISVFKYLEYSKNKIERNWKSINIERKKLLSTANESLIERRSQEYDKREQAQKSPRKQSKASDQLIQKMKNYPKSSDSPKLDYFSRLSMAKEQTELNNLFDLGHQCDRIENLTREIFDMQKAYFELISEQNNRISQIERMIDESAQDIEKGTEELKQSSKKLKHLSISLVILMLSAILFMKGWIKSHKY